MTEWTDDDDTCVIQIKHTSKDVVPYYHANDAANALEDYIGELEEIGFICNVELEDDSSADRRWSKFSNKADELDEKNNHKKKWISPDVWFRCLTEEELRDFLAQFASDEEEDDDDDDDDNEYGIISRIKSFADSVWSWLWDDDSLTEDEYEEGTEIYCEYHYA